ncbi:hypothetical protein HD_1395 [[Haemophilus] ducreyi 35000HP]|uniref:Uncharacterized protein n=1 Tax=Haemophilus ducreyi (strain 35000HP / ATCC 700724) TaxID=233412 RepID=Q7VLM8_HAEDU|nr:hypothetical protein HD_1395 [[Haemophilus] ducreyi 35000HP]
MQKISEKNRLCYDSCHCGLKNEIFNRLKMT